MKKSYSYKAGDKTIVRQYDYIPVRYIAAIMLTALEVVAIVSTVFVLCYYVPYFYLAAWATEIWCVIRIISSDDNPEYKVPWLLFVLILPVAGFMLYFVFYKRTLDKKLLSRLRRVNDEGYSHNCDDVCSELQKEDSASYGQAVSLMKTSGASLFRGGKVSYFPLGKDKHTALLRDLGEAESFIFMEYFIVEEGEFWNSILDILKEKAASGVEVRVIYDDIGCMTTLPGDYYKKLSTYGIHAVPFARLKGSADGEFNNRSHRKIAVIDGKVGYTGGVNLADEYIGAVIKHGHWKDVAVRIEGRGVWELTKLFLLDYSMNTKNLPEPEFDYYPDVPNVGNGYIVPFGDGPKPLYEYRVGKLAIMNMLETATRYVWITTPYLIIDNDMCTSLESAALKGVDVRIVVPHIPDKRIILEMTRSFYPRLMRAGVKIYEYTPGFIHAKTYLSDDKVAIVGTINMDYRSLVHHFECGLWMYNVDCIKNINEDISSTLSESMLISEEDIKVSLPRRFLRAVGRVFATLM